jgi:hypothetical protein
MKIKILLENGRFERKEEGTLRLKRKDWRGEI